MSGRHPADTHRSEKYWNSTVNHLTEVSDSPATARIRARIATCRESISCFTGATPVLLDCPGSPPERQVAAPTVTTEVLTDQEADHAGYAMP